MTDRTHPTPAELTAYVCGSGSPDADAFIEAHVAECGACARALQSEAQLEILLDDAAACITEAVPVADVAREVELDPPARPTLRSEARAGAVHGDRRPGWRAHVGPALAAAACVFVAVHLHEQLETSDKPELATAETRWAQSHAPDRRASHTSELRPQQRATFHHRRDRRERLAVATTTGLGNTPVPDAPACEQPWSVTQLGWDEQSLVASALGLADPAFEFVSGGMSEDFLALDYMPTAIPGEEVCLWPSSSG